MTDGRHWSGAAAELVEFSSMGSTCRGWLFLPAKLPAPVVVLGHGLGGTKECGLGVVAEDFTKEGWAGPRAHWNPCIPSER